MDEIAVAALGPDPSEGRFETPAYQGRFGDVMGIVVANTLLGIITLGIYRFWGKTRLRRYLWSRVSLTGEPFEYTGTAKELFIGFVIVMIILGPLFLLGVAASLWPTQVWLLAVSQIVPLVVVVVLVPIALFRARRYRLSRTLWRGVRFGQTGRSLPYCGRVVLWSALQALTLGILTPLKRTALQRYRTRHTWYGNARFSFDGRGRDLLWRWLLAWLLLPFTLFISYAWYRAAELRYFARRTGVAGLSFEMSIKGRSFVGYYLLYMLLLSPVLLIVYALIAGFSIGGSFGEPTPPQDFAAALTSGQQIALYASAFVAYLVSNAINTLVWTHNILGLLCRNTVVGGALDFAAIRQSDLDAPKHAEGLADIFDVGGL